MRQDNPILKNMLQTIGANYCHVLEVETVHNLHSCIESLCDQFNGVYADDDVVDFISSIEVYSLSDDSEGEELIFDYDLEYETRELLGMAL